MNGTDDTIRVLHVDDEPSLSDMVGTFLEREDDRITVQTATNAEEGHEMLVDHEVDCVVSDYDMPGQDGIEFLETVRDVYPNLPFILFTGKGSEEVASEAVSAGVSDYLQKESGTDQYTVLTNRILNLVTQYRAEIQLERVTRLREESEEYRDRLLEIALDQDRSPDETIHDLLALGCERFGVENGHLVMIDQEQERHNVISVVGSDIVQKGVSDLSNTYCRTTIASESHQEIHNAVEQGWENDPAYETYELGCYLGSKLTVGDRLVGTVCFVDEDPREPFIHHERAFFDMLARWLNQVLEHRQLKQAETIFESTQDALFVVDVTDESTFTIQRVNPAYEQLTGLGFEDLHGYTPREIVGDEQGAEVEARYQECVHQREPIEYEEQLDVGGTTKWWHTKLAPIIENGDVTQLIGATRDITDQKEREQRLHEEQQFVQSIFRSLPDPLYAFDTDGYPIRWNEQFEAVTGHSADEIEDMHVTEFVPEDEIDTIATNFRTILREERTVTVESAFETKDGTRIPYEFTGGPLEAPDGTRRGVTGVGRDITDRKRHTEQLRALNERSRMLMSADTSEQIAKIGIEAARKTLGLDASSIHLYDTEQSSLVPVAATDTLHDLIGDPPVFTRGESIAWRVYEKDEALALDDVRDDPDMLNPETPMRSELYFSLGDHGILLAGSPTPDAFDAQDVTLGKILAANIKSVLDQVRQTERLRAREAELTRQNDRLEEFTTIVSHDLRNPLNVADGSLELAREECDGEHLDRIDSALDRMDALIEDLLTLAREGETVTDLESVDLRATAEDCWTNVETADASLAIDLDRAIYADESRLKQVFENIVRNAVEHGGDDVTVTIGELDDGFYIEDDGPGIPEDERDNVFDAGYSTNEKGTGFGLSIVEQVIEAHDWEIRVIESESGGTRFEITDVEVIDK